MIEQIPISELNNNLMEDTSQSCSIYGHLMKMSSTLHSCNNVNLYSFKKTKSKFFLQYFFVTPFFFTRALLITKARAYSGQCHIIIILITMRQTVFSGLFSEHGDQMNPSCLNLTVLRIPKSARLTFL